MISRINKRKIADAQLFSAIGCYLEKDYIAAVTLAGASEEIYSAYIKASRAGKKNRKSKTSLGLYVSYCRIRGAKESNSALIGRANIIRNEFKHHGGKNKEWVRVNLIVAATVAIHRALENYYQLGGVKNDLISKFLRKSRDVG